MRRFISGLLVATMLATSTPAFADGTPATTPNIPVPALQPGEQSVGQVVSPLKQGQKAPFTGVLLSPEAIAKIIVDYQNAQNETDIQVKRAVGIQAAQDQLKIDDLTGALTYQKTVDATQIKAANDQINVLSKQLQDAENSKSSPVVWGSLGAVGGIVVTILTVFAVNKATH